MHKIFIIDFTKSFFFINSTFKEDIILNLKGNIDAKHIIYIHRIKYFYARMWQR